MKNERKLLRKLLAEYRFGVVKRPFTKERPRIVDAITFIVEALNEQN